MAARDKGTGARLPCAPRAHPPCRERLRPLCDGCWCDPTAVWWNAGACVAMAERRQPIQESDISGDRDLWFDPEVGVIDTTVVTETDLQPGFPSMCS